MIPREEGWGHQSLLCLFTGEGINRCCVYFLDIDECETHDCGEDGECMNTVGSFKCDCDDGYMENKKHICVGK